MDSVCLPSPSSPVISVGVLVVSIVVVGAFAIYLAKTRPFVAEAKAENGKERPEKRKR